MTEVEQAARYLEIETRAVSGKPLPEWLGWVLCLVSTAGPVIAYLIFR